MDQWKWTNGPWPGLIYICIFGLRHGGWVVGVGGATKGRREGTGAFTPASLKARICRVCRQPTSPPIAPQRGQVRELAGKGWCVNPEQSLRRQVRAWRGVQKCE